MRPSLPWLRLEKTHFGRSKEVSNLGFGDVVGEVANESGERRLVRERKLHPGRVRPLGALERGRAHAVALGAVGDAGEEVASSTIARLSGHGCG